jgi:hypothetical protein
MRKYIQTLKGMITNCYRSTTIELLKVHLLVFICRYSPKDSTFDFVLFILQSVKEMTMEEFMSKIAPFFRIVLIWELSQITAHRIRKIATVYYDVCDILLIGELNF